jgi:hypothetical protein
VWSVRPPALGGGDERVADGQPSDE